MLHRRAAALAAACALAGCASLGSGARDRLMEADRALSAVSVKLGAPEAFAQAFAAEGVQLGPSGPPAKGPAQVKASLAAAPPGLLSREPRHAEVSGDGDWGWTWGDWQLHEPGAGGRRLAQGRYLSVWKRQADGSWKLHGDLGGAPGR